MVINHIDTHAKVAFFAEFRKKTVAFVKTIQNYVRI